MNQDFLIGTSSESIDFWPGPVDLSTWTWAQYVKYVTTSLDSFGPKLSNLALSLYPPLTASTSRKESKIESSIPISSSSHDSTSIDGLSKSIGDMSHFSYSFTPANGKNDGEKKVESNDASNFTTVTTSITSSTSSDATIDEESRSNNEVLDEDTFTISLSPSVTSSTTESPKIASASNETSRSNGSSFSSSTVKDETFVDAATAATLPSNSNHLPVPSQTSNVSSTLPLTSTSMSPFLVNSIHGITLSEIESISKVNSIYDSPEKLYSSLVSDVRQTCPVQRLARQLMKQQQQQQQQQTNGQSLSDSMLRIYLYTVTGHPSSPVSMNGSMNLFAVTFGFFHGLYFVHVHVVHLANFSSYFEFALVFFPLSLSLFLHLFFFFFFFFFFSFFFLLLLGSFILPSIFKCTLDF